MTGPPVIGVLGGSGAVGRVAAERLAAWGLGTVRVGGRDLDRARAVADALPGGRGAALRADLADPASLERFCTGCAVVVNCAGPSYRVLDTVARAAIAAGADYVDAAGDVVALRALTADPPPGLAGRSALFSAGLMPGLSGLLPRLLAEVAGPLARLDVYVGGAAGIGPLSAVDTLLTRGPEFGTALAAWRGGAVAERALRPLRAVELPGFRGRVHAWPFLTAEAEGLARALDVGELRAYTVYVSEHIPQTLARAWADDGPVGAHVASVIAAADADIAIGGPWYAVLAHARPREHRAGAPTRLLLRTPDSYALSGVMAAIAARAQTEGAVAPGAGTVVDRLDPKVTAALLAEDPLVEELTLG